MRHRLWSPVHSRALWRGLRLTTVMVMVLNLGWITAAAAVASQVGTGLRGEDQPGVDGNEYESPTYGFTLEWDEDDWTVNRATSRRGTDLIELQSEATILTIAGTDDHEGDLVDCLAEAVEAFEITYVDEFGGDFEPQEDDDAEPIAGEDDDRVFAVFEGTDGTLDTDPFTGDEDVDLDLTFFVECRPLVEDDATLRISGFSIADEYEDELDLVNDVLDTLEIPEAQEPEGEEPTEEPEETIEPDETVEPTETPEQEETEEPAETEEPTEEATEEPTEEPEVTAEPEETEEPSDDAGVDGNEYESPIYGYTLEWDEDVWEVADATSDEEDEIDVLTLDSGATLLTFTGTADFDDDIDDCLDETVESIEDMDGVDSVDPALNANGDPIEVDEDDRVGVVVIVTLDDGDEIAYRVECRVLVEDDAVLSIVQETGLDDFNDERPIVDDVLDSLALAGEEEPEPTEEPTEEATEEPTEEPTEENGDEGGVDGNAYTSPTYGYSFEWDEDIWEVASEESDPLNGDFLVLGGRRSSIQFVGLDSFGGDAFLCVNGVADIFSEDDPDRGATIEEFEPLEDEDGDVIEGEDDGRAFAAFRVVESDQDGFEDEYAFYFECWTITEGESVLVIIQFIQPLEAFETEAERRDEILDTLVIPGLGDDDEGNGEDEDQDDEETPEPEETEEPDEEETPEDADDDDNDRDTAGANLQTYTSRLFGYTVSWDREVWTLTDRVVEDERDFIEIANEDGSITIEGQTRFDGNPAECLNTVTTNLRAIEGVRDWDRVNDLDLAPEGRDQGGANSLFSFTIAAEGRTPTPYYAFAECRELVPEESTLSIVYTVPAADYAAERDALGAVLASITVPEE